MMKFVTRAELRAYLAGVNVAASNRERPPEPRDNADRESVADILREAGAV